MCCSANENINLPSSFVIKPNTCKNLIINQCTKWMEWNNQKFSPEPITQRKRKGLNQSIKKISKTKRKTIKQKEIHEYE